MALTPEAEALIARRRREQLERINGERPMFDTAWTKGDYKLAEPGAECWAWTAEDAEREGIRVDRLRMNAFGEARGGIIIEITTNPDDDGDLHRAFRCIDYTLGDDQLWRAITVLEEPMVRPDSFEAANWSRIRNTYRRLCEQVGKKRQGRHEASFHELTMVSDAAKLAAIVARTLG